MSDRIDCKKCGKSVQKDLAEDRGFLCMPCWKKENGVYHFEILKVPEPIKGKPKPPEKLKGKAKKVDWGNLSFLSDEIKNSIMRLGAKPELNETLSPFENFACSFNWNSDSEYRSSTKLYAKMMINKGHLEYKKHEPDFLQDDIPHFSYDFNFLNSTNFYDGWQSEFSKTDVSLYTPFGSDGHYFYFLQENSNNRSDPIFAYVDHETVDEEPYSEENFTLSLFLGTLEKI